MSVRLPLHARLMGSSLVASALAYVLGVTFAAGVTGYGVYRVAHAVAGDLRQPPKLAITAAKAETSKSVPERDCNLSRGDRGPRSLHDADPGSLVRPGSVVEIFLP